MIIADLHLHSRYSRATSKDMTLQKLEKWAKVKGIGLLGTGDFTHPKWLAEIKAGLAEDGSGVLRTKGGFPFLLTAEVSNLFPQGGKARKVHHVILAPSFAVVEEINAFLTTKGKLASDGRPIFGKYPAKDLVADLRDIDKGIEAIPAHIWTPWFGLLGSKSGFDSVEECYGDEAKHIHALETGLSSDPEMNWRVSSLDRFTLVSFSDSHSYWPWRIGRESTIFNCALRYDEIINALRTKEGYAGTIEVDPGYGKYHLDGHRGCSVSLLPKDSAEHKDRCPKCGKPLTIGVLHRVEELADRSAGFRPKDAAHFQRLVPLHEIISAVLGCGASTKKAWKYYNALIDAFGSELSCMLEATPEELEKRAGKELAAAILDVREQRITIKPGYDGVYGVPVFR
ncbi:MAG: endonuclease Q family protein [Nanoarchaeota archaeon]